MLWLADRQIDLSRYPEQGSWQNTSLPEGKIIDYHLHVIISSFIDNNSFIWGTIKQSHGIMMKVIVHIYSVKGRFYTEPLIIEVNINTLVPCCTIGIFTNDGFRLTEVTKTSIAMRLIRWPQIRDKCMHKKSMDIKYLHILRTSIAIYCLPHLDIYSC